MAKKRFKNVLRDMMQEHRIIEAVEGVRESIKNSDASAYLKGKRLRQVADTNKMVEEALKRLSNKNYIPSDYSVFTIVENGKTRLIEACYDPVDKVIQKAITNELKRMLEPMLYYHSLCNVKGRGIQAGCDYIKKIIRREELIEKGIKEETGKTYKKAISNIGKMDVRHYYENINKELLLHKLSKKISDAHFLNLLSKFIYKYKNGLGLGGGMCAVLANFYLKDVDEYILHSIKKKAGNSVQGKRLRGGYYIRYMDDIVVFCTSKGTLHKIINHLKDILLPSLNLELKKNYYVAPFNPKDGVSYDKVRRLDFLGYTFNPKNTHIRKRTKFNIITKIRKLKKVGLKNAPDNLLRSLASLWGYIKNSDSYYIIRKYYSSYAGLIGDIRHEMKRRRNKRSVNKIKKFKKVIVNIVKSPINKISSFFKVENGSNKVLINENDIIIS